MSYQYHGTIDLIALPQRDVQTFPSGLVRVDRAYTCRKTLADRYRRDLAVGNPLPLDSGAPAIDGLYIFPEPREIVRDDGFIEFRVSAYGRTNTTGTQRAEFIRGSTFGLDFSFSQITVENCLPSSTALRDLLESPPVDLGFRKNPQTYVQTRKVVEIPKGSLVEEDVSLGGSIVLIGPKYILENGGLIIEWIEPSGRIYQSLYIYSQEIPIIISNSQRNFGFFTEFTTTYGWPAGSPIAATVLAGRFKINGVPV